jgi:hypothetical protein
VSVRLAGGMQRTYPLLHFWKEVKIEKKEETFQILIPKIESISSEKFSKELIACFHFSKYGVSNTTRAA